MKKVCLTAMMLVLMVVGAQAQAQFGVKGGYSYWHTVGSDAPDDAEGASGFHLGAMTSFELAESVHLRPELLLTYTSKDKFTESWIQIPVMGTVFLTENINLQFGPYLGILAVASADGESVRDMYKGYDFGVALGAGYELESGLNFGIRYNYGLVNPLDKISEDLDGDGVIDYEIDFSDAKIANGQLQLSVGYFFGR